MRRVHGGRNTPTYLVWARMKQSCDNPRATGYPYVGGRGIRYDPAWADFAQFLTDVGEAPEGCTLKRIDPREGYSKTNVHWLPRGKRAEPKEKTHADA